MRNSAAVPAGVLFWLFTAMIFDVQAATNSSTSAAMAKYSRMLSSVISARVNAVYARSGLNGNATAKMTLLIEPSGRVASVSFEPSSNPPAANAMALAAVPRAFPPPPLSKGASRLFVVVPLRFYRR